MKNLTKLFVLFMFSFAMTTYGQSSNEANGTKSLNEGTIQEQFDYLYKKSGRYQEYKVVKITNYNKIKGNVIDTLKSLNSKIIESNSVINDQNNEIQTLKENLKTTNDNLVNITKEKDNISFLGLSMDKATYKKIMWGLVFGLLAFLLFFIYQFKNSKTVTKLAQKNLAETEEEFEEFKRRSIDREQKVRRELQDEINKQKYGKKGGQ